MSSLINWFLFSRLLFSTLVLTLAACGGSAPQSSLNQALPTLHSGSREVPSSLPARASAVYAFVANYDTNDIATFKVDVASGTLNWVGNTPTGKGPGSVVLNAAGTYAYVPNFDSNDISTFAIHAESGALRQIGAPVAAGIWPAALSIAPSGRFAYVANFVSNNVSIYRVDAVTGALSSIGSAPTGVNPRYLVLEPSGKFLYTANWGSRNVSIFAANAETGALTPVGLPFSVRSTPFNLSASPNGSHLYMTSFLSGAGAHNVAALRIAPDTGALSDGGASVAAGAHPIAMAIHASGHFAYVANSLNGVGGNSVSAFSVNADTGAITPIESGYAAGTHPSYVSVSPSGTHLYVSNVSSNDIVIYAIHPTNGSLTRLTSIATRGAYPLGITFSPILI